MYKNLKGQGKVSVNQLAKKLLSLWLSMAMLLSIITPVSVVDLYAGDQRYIQVEYNIHTDSIDFKLKADGAEYAYIRGDFNAWTDQEDFKAIRSQDDQDWMGEMVVSVPFTRFKNQALGYKAYLYYPNANVPSEIKAGENHAWMKKDGYNNGDNENLDLSIRNLKLGRRVKTQYIGSSGAEEDRVTFTIKANGVSHGYIMCPGNDWSTDNIDSKYKFERPTSDTRKIEEMTLTLDYKDLIQEGQAYEYKLVLSYDGSDNHLEWMKADGSNGDGNSPLPDRTNPPQVPAPGQGDKTVATDYDEDEDRVTFHLRADGYDYAYLMCQANNWNEAKAYRFDREAADSGKREIMSLTLPYRLLISREKVGEYKVKLYKAGQSNGEWINAQGNDGDNSHFPKSSKTKPDSILFEPDRKSVETIFQPGQSGGEDGVLFKVKADGLDLAYVMCQANGWKTDDLASLNDYRAGRDINDGNKNGYLTVFIPYSKLRSDSKQGQYKMFAPLGGSGIWFDAQGQDQFDKNSFFPREQNNAAEDIIHSVIMDQKNELLVYLKPDYRDLDSQYEIWLHGQKQDAIISKQEIATIEVEYQNPWQLRKVTLDISNLWQDPNFDIRQELKVSSKGSSQAKKVLKRKVLDEYLYDGSDLGLSFTSDKITAKLWTPAAKAVDLLIYDHYRSDSFEVDKLNPVASFAMDYDGLTGLYSRQVDRLYEDKFYLYRLTFGDEVKYAVDPYAVAVGVNGKMAALVDINSPDTKPDGFDDHRRPELKNPEDSILYEMHIRDFTIDPDWGGKAEYAGKYLGLIQSGTTYSKNGKSFATGLDHLKELGITHVHLLPSYDFISTDESQPAPFDGTSPHEQARQRNWGYDPLNYNVPEGSYATNAQDPKTRIKEYRQMVMGLHEGGIRLVNDVVYNHMANMENMNNIAEGYYFRTWAEGTYSDDAGCGNAIESDHKMVRKFIIDSCHHWLEDYKVDGFRFDLMAVLDTDTMNQVKASIHQKDTSILIYGEPWMASRSPLAQDKRTDKNKGLAFFNDSYRDALRGSNSPSKGYVTGNFGQNVNPVLRGMGAGDVGDPEEIINYVEAHDNYAIWDQVEKSELGTSNGQFRQAIPENALDDWRVDKALLANAFVFLSQGIPFYQGGSEILRTKQGDHNSYKSNDEVNDYDWADKAEFDEVFNYYKGLIQIRKDQSLFRLTTKGDINAHQEVGKLNYQDGMIYQYLKNNTRPGEWKNIVVVYNATNSPQKITWLPGTYQAWTIAADDQGVYLDKPEAEREVIEKVGNDFDYQIAQNSLVIFYNYGEQKPKANIHWHYLFADQSQDYMEPLEPTADDEVKVRFRAKAGELTSAQVHYFVEGDRQARVVEMREVEDSFYTSRGYDKSKVSFYEAKIPAGPENKYYHFKAINHRSNQDEKVAWISGGKGENGRGVRQSMGDTGFSIVPDYKTSKWARESVFYQIMVDRFRDGDSENNKQEYDFAANGDKPELSQWHTEIFNGKESDGIWNNQFFGGDLVGVKEAIPYLKDVLGVDALYLMPIFQADSDHKYDSDSYEYIDANFGGNKSLADLGQALQAKGMNYILDGAFNHSSASGQLFKEHGNFFFRGPYRDENGKIYDHFPWHQKFFNFAKLDYSQAATKDYIYRSENAIAKRYLKAPYLAGGWRLDAAEDVSEIARDYKENGQTDEGQKASNLKIWQEFTGNLRQQSPDSFILGEYWGNENHWYYGKAWDGKMNYGGFYLPFVENNSKNPWLGSQSLDNKANASVADIVQFTRDYIKGFPYVSILNSTNSLSTHDKPRFLNNEYAGRDNVAMMQLGQTLQMTLPGIPLIYYGDEIGSYAKANGADPYNRQTFNWNDDQWNYTMLNTYRKLIQARKENKEAFVYGALEELERRHDQKYVVYARYGGQDKAIVVLNNNPSNGSRKVTITDVDRLGLREGQGLVDVLTGDKILVRDGKVEINSQDMAARCFVLDRGQDLLKELNAVDFDVNQILTDDTDQRRALDKPVRASYQPAGDQVLVTVDHAKQVGVKASLIRVLDKTGQKELQRVLLDQATGQASFSDLPLEFQIVVKTVADRDLADVEVKDIFRDSSYMAVKLDTKDKPKDDPKDKPKDDPKDKPKDDPKDKPKDDPKDDPKDKPKDKPQADSHLQPLLPPTAHQQANANQVMPQDQMLTGEGRVLLTDITKNMTRKADKDLVASFLARKISQKELMKSLSAQALREYGQDINQVYYDETNTSWYAQELSGIRLLRIVIGYGDGSFRGENKVIGKELVTMLVRMLELPLAESQDGNWFSPYRQAAQKANLLQGVDFDLNKELTREEVAYLIYQAIRLNMDRDPEAKAQAPFIDQAQISEKYLKQVSYLAENGIFKGFADGSYQAQKLISRAEIVAVLYRFLQRS